MQGGEFLRDGGGEPVSIFQYGVVCVCVVHQLAALGRGEVAALVVLQHGHVGVDVVVLSGDVLNEAPAVVVVHADARARVDDRLHRVAGSTQRHLHAGQSTHLD